MKQAEFEALTFDEVQDRAAGESDPAPGMPDYYDRPWTQMRDEMIAAAAKVVADLPPGRVDVFYHSTKSVYGSPFPDLG